MNHIKFSKWTLLIVAASTLLFNCSKKKDDPAPAPVEVPAPAPQTITYNFSDFGLGGTIKFTEVSSTQTKVELMVIGATNTNHPAHIHSNSAAETGPIVQPLSPVDGTGNSSTIVPLSFSTLVNYDGYINVHKADTALGTVIAQSDIGGNALTGVSKPYTLTAETGSSVGGTVTFNERKNGNTLAVVTLTNVSPGEKYGVYLYTGSATSPSSVLDVVLNDVDGSIKTSKSNIKFIQNTSTPLKYSNIINDPRFVKITASDKVTVVAKGNIGSNVK